MVIVEKNSFIKGFPDKILTGFKRITNRTTVSQKQAHFIPVVKLLVTERYHSKSYFFFAFAGSELNVILPNLNIQKKS